MNWIDWLQCPQWWGPSSRRGYSFAKNSSNEIGAFWLFLASNVLGSSGVSTMGPTLWIVLQVCLRCPECSGRNQVSVNRCKGKERNVCLRNTLCSLLSLFYSIGCLVPRVKAQQTRNLTEEFRMLNPSTLSFESKDRDIIVGFPLLTTATPNKRYPVLYMHDGEASWSVAT